MQVETHEVSKLNESYEAITVTLEGSNVGVNVNIDRLFEAMENGTDYYQVVDRAVSKIYNCNPNNFNHSLCNI